MYFQIYLCEIALKLHVNLCETFLRRSFLLSSLLFSNREIRHWGPNKTHCFSDNAVSECGKISQKPREYPIPQLVKLFSLREVFYFFLNFQPNRRCCVPCYIYHYDYKCELAKLCKSRNAKLSVRLLSMNLLFCDLPGRQE